MERNRMVVTWSQSRKAQIKEEQSDWLRERPLSREILEKGLASNPNVSWMLERKKTGTKPT